MSALTETINRLKVMSRQEYAWRPDEIASFKAAIKVLEAVGKIDRERAIKTLRRLYHPRFYDESDPNFPSVDIFDTLMKLIEALPEEK
jgi:hypothetical protein